MPILLDDVQKSVATTVQTFNPKFFSEKLTGRGGTSAGLLSAKNNPVTIDRNLTTCASHYSSNKREIRNGNTVSTQIPIYPLSKDSLDYMKTIQRPDLNDMVLIGHRKNGKEELYMDMSIFSIQINDTKVATQNGLGPMTTSREIIQCYLVRFFAVHDVNKTEHTLVDRANMTGRSNEYAQMLTSNPLQELQTAAYPDMQYTFDINTKTLIDFVTNYEIYDSVVRMSELWQTNIDKTMDEFLKNFQNPNVWQNSMGAYILRYQ